MINQGKKMTEKKSLDICDLIEEIKRIVAEYEIRRDGMHLFFGKVILNFERGRIDHIEKHEFIR